VAKEKYFGAEFTQKIRADYICEILVTILFSLLSSRLLSKNLNIKIHKIVVLPVVLYGCETWCLTLREEHKLNVSEQVAEENIWT
jgi:hypothetical protein